MISSEVQRTLVKSPPELWAELSDPESLARHLGAIDGIGEVKITRIEPEKLVEWEAEDTTGSVAIKASGWGTKVTLRVERELPAPEAAEEEVEAVETVEAEVSVPEPESAPEPSHVEPEPSHAEPSHVEPEHEEEIAQPVAEASEPRAVAEPAKRPGFFARLFGRKRRAEPEPAPVLEAEAIAAPVQEPEPAPQAPASEPEPDPPPGIVEPAGETIALDIEAAEALEPEEPAPAPQPETPDLAAELHEAEEQVTAALTAVLDRLGSAHHRPFSRS